MAITSSLYRQVQAGSQSPLSQVQTITSNFELSQSEVVSAGAYVTLPITVGKANISCFYIQVDDVTGGSAFTEDMDFVAGTSTFTFQKTVPIFWSSGSNLTNPLPSGGLANPVLHNKSATVDAQVDMRVLYNS